MVELVPAASAEEISNFCCKQVASCAERRGRAYARDETNKYTGKLEQLPSKVRRHASNAVMAGVGHIKSSAVAQQTYIRGRSCNVDSSEHPSLREKKHEENIKGSIPIHPHPANNIDRVFSSSQNHHGRIRRRRLRKSPSKKGYRWRPEGHNCTSKPTAEQTARRRLPEYNGR